MKQIREFAIKWADKFQQRDIDCLELTDHHMADECAALGFVMDCGHGFSEKYGDAVYDHESLERIIGQITDIPLLGSAIYSRWRYFNHWAYMDEEILEPQNRAWFTIALGRLEELAQGCLKRFKGTVQRVRIVSNNICFGPPPEPDDEIEQRITINTDGRVWFSAYQFGSGFGEHTKARTRRYKIEKTSASHLLNAIARYFANDYIAAFATDVGTWEMEITNTEEQVYRYSGSLISDFLVDGVDLSDMVRDALAMEDLYVFDGNRKPDRVERIIVDYQRLTTITPGQPVSGTGNRATRQYTEKLVLDRASGSLEHIQCLDRGYLVSKKYRIPGETEALLDDMDPQDLFGGMEGDPTGMPDNPSETGTYTITVDFKRGSQRIIRGTYDKKALPEFWSDFADSVWRSIRSYEKGEILDPVFYGKVRRSGAELIYCSVKFEEGSKSYYYISDEDNIAVGDFVIVPVGKENHHSKAEVVKVEYFSEADVPLPAAYTKRIIRKCTKPDFTSPL